MYQAINFKRQQTTAQPIWLLLHLDSPLILPTLPLPRLRTAINLLLGTFQVCSPSTSPPSICILTNILESITSRTTALISIILHNFYIWIPKLTPFSTTRKSGNFDDIFCLPSEIRLDLYAKEDISKPLYFIPGEKFNSQLIDNLHVQHFGFYLLHIVSADLLVPVDYHKVLSLFQDGLPATPAMWRELITNIYDFTNLLQHYFSNIFCPTGPLSIFSRF